MAEKSFMPNIIAIGSSAGGPEALIRLFTDMAGKLSNIPVLITQHTPYPATNFLSGEVENVSMHPCTEAIHGESINKGHIYFAPPNFHMTVEKSPLGPIISLNQDAKENMCRPAVDPMVRSILKVYGRKTLLIILTGMGNDGLEAAKMVIENHGQVVIQDKNTSLVWGMPGSIAKAGHYTKMLPLGEISNYICQVLS